MVPLAVSTEGSGEAHRLVIVIYSSDNSLQDHSTQKIELR